MAGIYLHIPFCKKKCFYCDFYSNTEIRLSQQLIESELLEIKIRREYLQEEEVSSVYFGGGSPSMLSTQQVQVLLEGINNNFIVVSDAEITFECNPDDLTKEYLTGLKELGINRISLGVQSFEDDILKFLNRRHLSEQAESAIEWIKETGFKDLSVDLIFGIPGLTKEIYLRTLERAIKLQPQHISAYQLTIERGTVFYKKMLSNKFQKVEEEEVLSQFDLTIETLKSNGYFQYEISNYSKVGHESRHNWNYWNGGRYLGIGPSAHSYDGNSRQWNINNTNNYISCIHKGESFFEKEILTEIDKYNEYILTGLRTNKGISEDFVYRNFNIRVYNHFIKVLQRFVNEGYIGSTCFNTKALLKKGIFILDFIVGQFYYN